MSLVARGSGDQEGTNQIWSFGSNDEDMRNPTHDTMYVRFEEGSFDEEKVTGKCFVLTGGYKSPVTVKVHSLLESFDIPFSSYNIVLSDFDDTLSYVNDMLIFVSGEAKKSKSLLLETHKRLESKRRRVDNIELQLKNITLDTDDVNSVIFIAIVQNDCMLE